MRIEGFFIATRWMLISDILEGALLRLKLSLIFFYVLYAVIPRLDRRIQIASTHLKIFWQAKIISSLFHTLLLVTLSPPVKSQGDDFSAQEENKYLLRNDFFPQSLVEWLTFLESPRIVRLIDNTFSLACAIAGQFTPWFLFGKIAVVTG